MQDRHDMVANSQPKETVIESKISCSGITIRFTSMLSLMNRNAPVGDCMSLAQTQSGRSRETGLFVGVE